MKPDNITPPQLQWQDQQAQNTHYQDAYFSRDGGLDESRYVFLQGNDLAARFEQSARFRIAELGFGSGLNFLLSWALWERCAQPASRLDYLAVEAQPLADEQIRRMLQGWTQLQHRLNQLCSQLPPPQPGFHNIDLSPQVRLHLLYGDVSEMLERCPGQINAWFLDGFAPARNPRMWSHETLDKVAKLSAATASFATYSAAGQVRRNLQQSGFEVHKRAGFGRKREMLIGRMPSSHRAPKHWLRWPQGQAVDVSILGDGLAGSSLARQLAEQGLRVRLIGNRQGSSQRIPAMLVRSYPERTASISHRLHQRAFELAHRFYQRYCAAAYEEQTLDQPGGQQLAGRLLTEPALRLLRQHPAIEYQACDIAQAHAEKTGWKLSVTGGETLHCQELVLCSGKPPAGLCLPLPISPCAGQVIQTDTVIERGFADSLHAIPLADGTQLGSSYRPDSANIQISDEESTELLDKAVQRGLAIDAKTKIEAAYSATRFSSPDHLPLIGPAPDLERWPSLQRQFENQRRSDNKPDAPLIPGLWLNLAHGSRGASMAPLAALLLSAALENRPLPLERDLLKALHPGRFATRNTRRGQP